MIQRPEQHHETYLMEAKQAERRLDAFRSRVEALESSPRATSTSHPDLLDNCIPESFGYEVIPKNEEALACTPKSEGTKTFWPLSRGKKERDSRSNALLSVEPTIDGSDQDPMLGNDGLVVESSCAGTYEVESFKQMRKSNEEGLEVVGLGRYSTIEDPQPHRDDDALLQVTSLENDTTNQDPQLSQVFKSSPTIDVAFYRPIHMKED